jgi:zinc protease
VALSWVTPIDERPDSRAKRIDVVRNQIALQVFAQRLVRRSRSENPPFPAAFANLSLPGQRARLVEVIGLVPNGAWQATLGALEEERRQAVTQGLQATELAEVFAGLRAQVAAAVAKDASVPAPARADAIAAITGGGDIVVSAKESEVIVEQAIAGYDAGEATQRLAFLIGKAEPRMLMVTPKDIEGGAAAVAAAWKQLSQRQVAQRKEVTASTWPYTSFGVAGIPSPATRFDSINASVFAFPNGVRVAIKQTKFQEGEVQVGLRFGRGIRGFDAAKPVPGFLWGSGVLVEAGLGKLDAQQLQSALAGKVVSMSPGADTDALTLSAVTRTADLGTQLQLFAAQLADPGWRPEVIERVRQVAPAIIGNAYATPKTLFALEGSYYLRGQDARLSPPTVKQLQAATMDEVQAAFAPEFQAGPVDLTIVGDVEPAVALKLASETLGAITDAQDSDRGAEAWPVSKARAADAVSRGAAGPGVGRDRVADQGFCA